MAKLKVIELTDPVPAYGEVLVWLQGAALNFLDLAVATGKYPLPSFAIVRVTDGTSQVVALGPGVSISRVSYYLSEIRRDHDVVAFIRKNALQLLRDVRIFFRYKQGAR
ncbi:hypothetical protein ACPOL_3254 [Acidisarcina polymorpha]|uniref:Quinone oxidoreductase n=1 Tax=Acidisarcina polymorpha TaxID=2211140 RepID=A0A2Z5G1D2_9BACT|nr:hypothetical protein [Acidisarcina polymorpha]AXC12547.1 hypothetical protein ACPOL_3254 [Acidisarcina polymorpha]